MPIAASGRCGGGRNAPVVDDRSPYNPADRVRGQEGRLRTMTTLTDAEVEGFRNFCQLTYDRWVTRRVIFEHADVEAFTYHKCADVLRLLNDITIEHTLLQMA